MKSKIAIIFFLSITFLNANTAEQKLIKNLSINDFKELKESLKSGADINTTAGIYKQTPLLIAVIDGNLELAKYLIENGANVNTTSITNRSVLNYALYQDDEEFLKFLFEKGLKIDISKQTKEAILYAIKTNKSKMIKILLENGADLSVVDDFGNSVISYAIKSKNNELFFKAFDVSNLEVRFDYDFFDKFTIDSKNDSKQSIKDFNLLHLAARYGTKEMIEALLKTGKFDIEETTKEFFSYSSIAIAASYKNYETFIALVNNNANIYKKFKSLNQHSFGLGYWLGAGDAYTLLGLSITGEKNKIDERIVNFLISNEDIKKIVELEDENFYLNFSILALNEPNGVYAKVLDALDKNGFQKSEKLENELLKMKKQPKEVSKEKVEYLNNDKVFDLIHNCKKDEIAIISFIKEKNIELNEIHKKSNYYQLPILMQVVGDCSSELALELIKNGANVNETFDGKNLLDRIFDVGIEKRHEKLIEYILNNTKQAQKSFGSNDSFHSFLFSAYGEVELFDKFVKYGAKIDNHKFEEYFKLPKSKKLLFKLLDFNKNNLTKNRIEDLIITVSNANESNKINIEHIMEYAVINKIPINLSAVMYMGLVRNEPKIVNKALLLGADKNYYYKNLSGCDVLSSKKNSDKYLLEFFCEEKNK